MTTTTELPGRAGRHLTADDLAELYAAHRLSLVRLAILLVDDQASAEDVVQDAFATMASRLHKLRDPHAALGYLRTSVVNGSRSALRRRRTARAYVPPAEAEPPGPDDRVVLAEEHREVLAGLERLAPRQREVLVLRYWSGLSEAEIAEACGISRGSVKSTASRALDALEQILKGEGR
ncbi:RNA polymerase sigma factor [Nocardioides sp.]|uniref:RNA polymerase sigma factor n=1 Tax=Nocardioides sp. TaxID=35761 RepID=UPI00271FE655|nr:SigE family RNA polymerase sigma factor [Nocardioides sp.]MDO9457339.1 SigE family RNA polymerase sigma factor [Nocardioides sp.]